MKKTTILCDIDENGKFKFSDTGKKLLNKFTQKNILKNCEMTIEIVDTPEYHQHKYYRGWVLPYISRSQDCISDQHCHDFIVKRELLYFEINDISEIPRRHLRRDCKFFTKIIDGEEKIVAYIPSTATLTFKEMKEFILKAEDLLRTFTNMSLLSETEIEERANMRKRAFNETI